MLTKPIYLVVGNSSGGILEIYRDGALPLVFEKRKLAEKHRRKINRRTWRGMVRVHKVWVIR